MNDFKVKTYKGRKLRRKQTEEIARVNMLRNKFQAEQK